MSAYPFTSSYPFNTPPSGYQPQNNYQQYVNVPPYQQQSPQIMNPAIAVNQGNMQDERIWVPSAAAAEAYPIAANGFVRLWHSTQPVFYEKSADAAGRPFPMIAYEYKLMGADTEQQSPTVEIPDFEPRFKALEERLEALEKAGTSNTNNNGNSKKEDNKK